MPSCYKSNNITEHWDGSNIPSPQLDAAVMLAVFLIAVQALVLPSYSDYTYSDFSFEMEVDYGGYGGGWEIDTFPKESKFVTSEPHQPLLIMFGNVQSLMISWRMKVKQLVSEARVALLLLLLLN